MKPTFALLATLTACAVQVDDSDTTSTSAAVSGDPCAAIHGWIKSSKASVDRRTATRAELLVNLSWQVTIPSTCDQEISATIEDIPLDVEQEGETTSYFTIEVDRTKNFHLRVNGRVLDSVIVTAIGDPGIVSISPGRDLAQSDLDQFDAWNMQPFIRERILDNAYGEVWQRHTGEMWEVFDVSHGMARMFDLTHDPQYAAYLHDMSRLLMKTRDDFHPLDEEPLPGKPRLPVMPAAIDLTRGQTRPLPAWGGRGLWSAGYHMINDASLAYMYSIAANARIVLETPSLRAQHSAVVLEELGKLFATDELFAAQLVSRNTDSGPETRLVNPILARFPTRAECDAELARLGLDPSDDRVDVHLRGCYEIGNGQGATTAYNYAFIYMAAMTELWRALDTPTARASITDPRAETLRSEIPVRISRMLNYFKRRQEAGDTYVWNYNDEVAPGVNTHVEDASHGSIDMVGLDVVRMNMDRLNTVARPRGEPMQPLTSGELARYGRTVTTKLLQHDPTQINMAEDLTGRPPEKDRNYACDGWVNFAEADRAVYDRCYAVTFRESGHTQPNLNMPAWVSLLKNKHWVQRPASSAADILWRSSDAPYMEIWNGADAAARSTVFNAEPHWLVAGLGDFDRNGRLDILWRSLAGYNEIWFDGDWSRKSLLGFVDTTWTVRSVADFGGDGKSDILWHRSDGVLAIWHSGNSATSSFPGTVGAPWVFEKTGDFNGNGKSDILWRHAGGTLAIWYDANSALANYPGVVDSSWTILAAADFDGNHRSDILWRHVSGAFAIWLDADSSRPLYPGAPPAGWSFSGTGDFDGNGKSDILWQTALGGVMVWRDADPGAPRFLQAVPPGTQFQGAGQLR